MGAWILQGNPTMFDIDTYIAESANYAPLYWRSHGAKESELQAGDRVFLWRANANNAKRGGLVALGFLESGVVTKRLVDISSRKLHKMPVSSSDEAKLVQFRVDEYRLEPTTGMINRLEVKARPEFQGHPLFTRGVGSAFSITPAQERALLDLWKRSK